MTERELFSASELPVVETRHAEGAGPVVLVCEHASAAIPAALGDLGLSPEARFSHIAWDPGALAVAERMARALDSPLVAARWSRLVYDCNRPPEAADAIPETSEVHAVPGNRGLDPTARARRAAEVYEPFHARLAAVLDTIARRGAAPVLVTVHSFTPVYFGRPRAVEIGILHGSDARLADALLAQGQGGGPLAGYDLRRNAPYGPGDGVLHSLRRHALPQGLLNAMIEIRNDLIGDEGGQAALADALAAALGRALARLRSTSTMTEG
jgi:predicted N-formylglutamate amidohydrolase